MSGAKKLVLTSCCGCPYSKYVNEWSEDARDDLPTPYCTHDDTRNKHGFTTRNPLPIPYKDEPQVFPDGSPVMVTPRHLEGVSDKKRQRYRRVQTEFPWQCPLEDNNDD